jgi:hypothetical protein
VDRGLLEQSLFIMSEVLDFTGSSKQVPQLAFPEIFPATIITT